MGRPRDPKLDDADVIDELIERIIAGESIVVICSEESMPSARSLYREMANKPEFGVTIARAQEIGQSAAVDKCREIAEKSTPDSWQRDKFLVSTIQWEAGKRQAKRFGDKLDMNLGGEVVVKRVVSDL
jgi:hypothetical protein